MTTDTDKALITVGFWGALLEGWKSGLTKPTQDNFKIQAMRADWPKTLTGAAVFGLVIGLWDIAIRWVSQSAGWDALSILAGSLRTIGISWAGFITISLLLFLIAKCFGGKGNLKEQGYLISLVSVPLGLIFGAGIFISSALGWLSPSAIFNPLGGSGLVSVFLILFTLYGLLLLMLVLQASHDVTANQALYILGIPVLAWFLLKIIYMFINGVDNTITTVGLFIADQSSKGVAQELLIGHLWLVGFSVAIAVVLGILMGIFITWPSRRPQTSHLLILIPLVIFLLLWAVSSGVLGEGLAEQISSTTTTWSRSLKRIDNLFFGPPLKIIAAIIAKPASFGMIIAVFTVLLYILYLAGETAGDLTLYIAGIILTIPSVALFGAMIKPLGIGPFNAAFALILYAQLPIMRNTYTGIKAVAPEIIEAGHGMGMTRGQLLLRVKLPMAVPVIMAGVRISIVMLIGIASIAAYIGNDTLGKYIFDGIYRAQEKRYYAGALLVAILALAVDYFLGWLQNRLTPKGLRSRREAA